jgi:hypothetical protein
MLRTLGIPAREAIGYVPGPFNPLTDLYEVQAKDAHAWVQVWFPRYGWQSFDPTAVVPLANPTPGVILFHDIGRALGSLPLIPLGVVLVVMAATALLWRWRRHRPATWALAVARRMEHAGARARRPRRRGETLTEYAAALDAMSGDASGTWSVLASVVEASAYGHHEPAHDERQRLERLSRTVRVDRRARDRAPGRASSALPGARHHAHGAGPDADLVGAATVRPAAVPAPRRDSPAPPPGDESPSTDGAG